MEEENTTSLPVSAPIPRRSGRIVREFDKFMFLGEAYEAISESSESNLTSYNEAMANSDSSRWVKAMKAEMKFMNSN